MTMFVPPEASAAEAIRRPKVLVLTARLPFPPIGGDRLRILEICRALAEHADLTLLSLCETSTEMELPPPPGIFTHCERVLLPRWRSRLQTLTGLFSRTPLQIAYYRNDAFRQRANALARENDLVLCHLIRTAPYAVGMGRPFGLEMTDAVSMTYARAAALPLQRSIKSLVYRIELARVRRYERNIASKARFISLVSGVDAAWLQQQGVPSHHIVVAGNGVNLARRRVTRASNPDEIIFIGHMATLQNQDSIRYFLQQVKPRLDPVRRLKLRLIGPCPDSFTHELQGDPDVIVHGIADDISEAAENAVCGICFMRIAGGIQNKILDYMSIGIPAVVNSIAWEGLKAKPGEELECFDNPDEQARAILTLAAADDNRWHYLSERGYDYVTRHHGWHEVLAPLVSRVMANAMTPQ